jgi:dye decolorizing peroxidase
VLRIVSYDAVRLTQGQPALGDTEPENAANPAGLTITIGIARQALDRVGRSELVPPQLIDLPAFTTDRLQDSWGQTDLLLQIGSNDALTLAHTVRMLTKDLSTLTHVRWTQPGFRSTTAAVSGGTTTRNLMGQVDGTINPTAGTSDYDDVVWIGDGPPWVAGGTILVLRRIRMLLDSWDALDRATQEIVMGRHVASGAPLGGSKETDPVPFDALDANGLPVIPADSHVRVAHAQTLRERLLRRPYSYDNGIVDGTNDMGLLFAAYMREPATSFVPVQTRIAEQDAFNRWNTTIGSAVYLLPSGAAQGGYVGEGMLA